MKENYEQQSGEALEEKLVGVNRVASNCNSKSSRKCPKKYD